MHVDKPRHHVAPSEVYDPVGNAPGGHDTPPVDGKLPGRKTTAVINYGIGIKRFHLRKRKKQATETVTLIKQNRRKPEEIRRPTNSLAARKPAPTICWVYNS